MSRGCCDRKKCRYYSPPSHHSPNTCNYMMFTGKSRIAQIPDKKARRDWANCPCFQEGQNLKGKLFSPGELRLAYDWAEAYKLYRAGALDRDIAAAIGCSVSGVKWWRRKSGLPSNWRPQNG